MRFLKVGAVIFGAVVITALGIDAADTLQGKSGSLLSQVISTPGECPEGMVSVSGIATVRCADAYESAPSGACPHAVPGNIFDTEANLAASECTPVAAHDATPWRFVTREQAMQLCARRGARLPESGEWYQLALSVPDPDDTCNVDTRSLDRSGAFPACVSADGVYDLPGNAWEWVSDDVIEGVYNGRELPGTGYVVQVDNTGVATAVADEASGVHGDDYFWSKEDGAYGMLRGGFYGSERDAGIYAVHADTPPNTSGTAIGFRCVI